MRHSAITKSLRTNFSRLPVTGMSQVKGKSAPKHGVLPFAAVDDVPAAAAPSGHHQLCRLNIIHHCSKAAKPFPQAVADPFHKGADAGGVLERAVSDRPTPDRKAQAPPDVGQFCAAFNWNLLLNPIGGRGIRMKQGGSFVSGKSAIMAPLASRRKDAPLLSARGSPGNRPDCGGPVLPE